MTTHRLDGCRLEPFASYLKACGVLRLVGEQADPGATGLWHGDTFHLSTTLDSDELVEFFTREYRPTPVVSPWNGGSGFGPKDQQVGIAAIEDSSDPRLAAYRATIEVARRLVADPSWDAGGKDAKRRQVGWCRAELPDEAVPWLDATVVLTSDRAVFPPLFGTGGNDGRLDFSNNFMQRVADLLLNPPKRNEDPARWARAALFGGDPGRLRDATAGQYDPQANEFPSLSQTGGERSVSNLWDFVLLIEGGLLFASGAARRLGPSASSKAAMPFCVDQSAVGYPSAAAGENARGEIWSPVWRAPVTSPELARLVGEGRAEWAGRPARNGVDFAKAVATLGVDRGIDRFVRRGLVERYGRTYFAIPLGEVVVGERPEVDVVRQLDGWLDSLRDLPAAAASARRGVEAASFAVAAGQRSAARGLQDVLIAAADLESIISRSARRSDHAARPIGGAARLSGADWLPRLDDGTAELRLAAVLASGRDPSFSGPIDGPAQRASSLALLLRPVVLDDRGRLIWSLSGPQVEGVGTRPIIEVLADALARREIEAGRRGGADGDSDVIGPDVAFGRALRADVADIGDLLAGRLDLHRLGHLVRGLLLLDWRADSVSAPKRGADPGGEALPLSPVMCVLLPFFQPEPVLARGRDGANVEVRLRPVAGWTRRLASGDDRQIDAVLSEALARLRQAGLDPAPRLVRRGIGETGPVLATAALCRLSGRSTRRLLTELCPTLFTQPAESSDDELEHIAPEEAP